MTTTTPPTITHRIAYDRDTRDYACYVQVGGDPEQYIGSAASYHTGELKCLAYRRDLLESDVFRTATDLDGVCGDCVQALDSMGLCGCQDAASIPTRTVTIPSCDQHAGFSFNTITLTLVWRCPTCGGPRGEPYETCSYDGSRRLGGVHGWRNPCGHVDYYSDVRTEQPARDEYQDDQARYRDAEADAPWAAPINTDDTQLAAAWRAYKAGALLWTDVQAIQASLMPRCADHNRPAAILLNKRLACPACVEDDLDMITGDVGGIVAYVNGKRTIVSPGDY